MSNTSNRGTGHPGFCNRVTMHPGDCDRDSTGVWKVRGAALRALQKQPLSTRQGTLGALCRTWCERCPRCRFVSYSAATNATMLCSWYAHCDMADLHSWWSQHLEFARWHTDQIRTRLDAPLAREGVQSIDTPPSVATSPTFRLGLATMQIGGYMRCGLLGWCQSASRLQHVLQWPWEVELLVLTDTPIEPHDRECPQARHLVADPELLNYARVCKKKVHGSWKQVKAPPKPPWKRTHDMYPMAPAVMARWQLFALTAYDVIFYTDLDVDMLPVAISNLEAVTKRWQLAVESFLSAQPRRHMVASLDHESPVNTGTLLIRPSTRLFHEGLEHLRTCRFNASHGWDHVGSPRSLPLEEYRMVLWRPWPNSMLNGTKAFRINEWAFVCSAQDQGFFWFMLFVKHHYGLYFSEHWGQPKPVYYVNHFWGGGAGMKPWSRKGRGANIMYLNRIEPDPALEYSRCHRRLSESRREEERKVAEKHRNGLSFQVKAPKTVHIW